MTLNSYVSSIEIIVPFNPPITQIKLSKKIKGKYICATYICEYLTYLYTKTIKKMIHLPAMGQLSSPIASSVESSKKIMCGYGRMFYTHQFRGQNKRNFDTLQYKRAVVANFFPFFMYSYSFVVHRKRFKNVCPCIVCSL